MGWNLIRTERHRSLTLAPDPQCPLGPDPDLPVAIPRPEADLEVPSDPEIRNFRSPDFRFGRETGRESPDFRLGIGNGEVARFPIGRKSENRGCPAGASAAAMILGWMLH